MLEHVEDDRGLLAQAFGLLNHGGHMLVSVPAHQDRFSAVDELVGHVRRYEREELRARFEEAGLPGRGPVELRLPAGQPPGAGAPRRDQPARARQPRGAAPRTAESGNVVPARGLVKLLVRPVTMAPFLLAQRRFLGTDRGDGYLLLARKPAAT